ncbi:MAG: hypothetical protein ACI9SJ_000385 [Flavobacteriaceae bacterium]|uniref:Kdo domain containing protein n=1 Tax=Candidatus Marifrigoribacter sp. Uisw_064 TaxID=3230970 RepID=UPI003ADC92F5
MLKVVYLDMNIRFSVKYKTQQEAILNVIDEFHSKGEKVGNGDRNTIKNFEVNGKTITVKLFKIPNLINKVVYKYFRKSKAERSFENALYLINNNIGTPEPIAYLEEKKRFSLAKSYYISEHIDADLTYRELIFQLDYPEREKIIREFTAFTFSLHENGILFKDHSPGNTLIKKNGDHYMFYLVDLNRMEFKELSFEERIVNFSRLTPREDMVVIMSDAYAKLTSWSYEEIYVMMWSKTQKFQKQFFRKKNLKKKYLFWRK